MREGNSFVEMQCLCSYSTLSLFHLLNLYLVSENEGSNQQASVVGREGYLANLEPT